jgi:organic hydroperoxide reductase OsmC/OhrA
MAEHDYEIELNWTGNLGPGTTSYRDYSRDHTLSADGVALEIPASSAPEYRGDVTRWNPELLLVAAVSECHMLWYLHFCATNGVVVTSYVDKAVGTLNAVNEPHQAKFTSLTLRPQVVVQSADMIQKAISLHEDANAYCFIANSLNLPVGHEPTVTSAG